MSDDSDNFARTVRHDCLSGLDQSAACVGHIVDENGNSVLNIADKDHTGDFVGAGALFVDEGEAEIEAVGDGGCSVQRIKLASYFFHGNLHLLSLGELNMPQFYMEMSMKG
jgi:hypothetical protein